MQVSLRIQAYRPCKKFYGALNQVYDADYSRGILSQIIAEVTLEKCGEKRLTSTGKRLWSLDEFVIRIQRPFSVKYIEQIAKFVKT